MTLLTFLVPLVGLISPHTFTEVDPVIHREANRAIRPVDDKDGNIGAHLVVHVTKDDELVGLRCTFQLAEYHYEHSLPTLIGDELLQQPIKR